MGRRSINTTKSGKYMNPTDQARKEARKLELKKNKKQRQMVRAAVLKGKDPAQIIEEMEKIDQMEFNVLQPSPLNEKVLKDKRKKLRDTLERVLLMYHKDDMEKWSELKRVQADYERRRAQLVAFYESVKHAQQVSVDDIPLPTVQVPDHASSSSIFSSSIAAKIPLPTGDIKLPESVASKVPIGILKKVSAIGAAQHHLHQQQSSASQSQMDTDEEPPGVPVGPPPDLSSCSEGEEEDKESVMNTSKTIRFSDEVTVSNTDDGDGDGDEDGEAITTDLGRGERTTVKPTSLQQKMLALSGQNVDDFMKEMEVVQKVKDTEVSEERTVTKLTGSSSLRAPDTSLAPPGTSDVPPPHQHQQQRQVMPPPMMFPPTLRLPPGPPPGRPNLPPGPPPGLPPRLTMRIPPAPPRMLRLPTPPINLPPAALAAATPNVLSAGPQLINRSDSTKQGATIMAKPQIRNLSADVTRFVPSALRVKREDKKQKTNSRTLVNELKQKEILSHAMLTAGQPTKDDAYMQFMREMEGLL